MNNYKYITRTIVLLFGLFLMSDLLSQEEDYGDHDHYPIYYKETEYTLEEINELPKDTLYLHDTIYVSEIDEFLKQYNCDLKQFVEKYGSMKEMMDSINNISGMRLYYNFFITQDSICKVSNRFIVKEFKIGSIGRRDTVLGYDIPLANSEISEDQVADVRREILFRISGAERTDRFLSNPDIMLKAISRIFTYMQEDTTGIEGINLYFPDFTFKKKKAMTQFVKSVRITMEASKKFKFRDIRLNVTFDAKKGMEAVDKNFQYCLMQEASEVLYLSEPDVIDNYYVRGQRITSQDMKEIGFFAQFINHLYIARYYTCDENIGERNMEDFKPGAIAFVLTADFPENTWELYFYILIGIVVFIIILIILYSTYLPFSTLINENMESILLIAIVFVFEIVALIVTMFQYMCQEDSFVIIENNPHLIFTIPLVLVLVIPFMVGVFKKKRIP